MNTRQDQIEDAVRATVFHSATVFSWYGKREKAIPRKTRATLSAEGLRNVVLSRLKTRLYTSFYSKGAATPVPAHDPRLAGQVDGSPFVEQLRRANRGPGYWADGWKVISVDKETAIIESGGRFFTAQANECRAASGASLAPGAEAAVHFPNERRSISPGFYMTVHRGLRVREELIVRVYWNTTPEGAVILTREITSALGQGDLRFHFKTATSLESYARCDSSVLYFSGSDYLAVRALLEQIYPRVADGLQPATPAFTKRLAPGIGLAEDPGEKLSFGEHRCNILAEGLLSAHEQGKKSLADRMTIVRTRFAEAEIDLEAPFLNPGSADRYTFDFRPRVSLPVPSSSLGLNEPARAPHNGRQKHEAYLRTAQAIASRLCGDALWHAGHCNWVGPDPSSEGARFGALGPGIYDGTSGVGLFLAELCTVRQDAACARTARAALLQALSAVDTVPGPQRLGFYNGWIGIAYAAARAGELLSDTELIGQARSLLDRCTREPVGNCDLDVISGIAGGIPALLALSSMLSDQAPAELAKRLGNHILDQAVDVHGALCWPTVNARNETYLTGFSHGNSGISWALLELYAATGDSRYRNAAELGLAYERRWFDAEAGNWPDFRGVARWSKGPAPLVPCMTAWCHGAPGIALSRLRAYQILGDERYKDDAIIALQTTRAALQHERNRMSENYSLCHGLVGNADVLLTGRRVLGNAASFGERPAFGVANFGIEAHARGGDWPCGTRGARPGLMLGLAGIGHFYLRRACQSTPSVLMVGPAEL